MIIQKDLPDTIAAEAYEQYIVPALNSRLAEEAVRTAALEPGERLLDVACGTGLELPDLDQRRGTVGF